MNKIIQQNFKVEFNYNISFTEGVFDVNNPLLSNLLTSKNKNSTTRAVVILDKGMFYYHSYLIEQIQTYFKKCCLKIQLMGEPLMVEGGEGVKNKWSVVENVLDLVNKKKIDRHSFVIAVGGGAVLDMVGFASAIAHRGIQIIRIPTTVLSQNDSGVGVKNSINYFDKKNFLGTFQPPFAVINDQTFLTTLSDRHWRSGISEAIKVALIKDSLFFNWIEDHITLLNNRDPETMNNLIFKCAQLHTAHIGGGDPFEKGSSRPLDFGHWAAHKLEYLTNYELTHGEAVAIGIALDSCYSYCIGYLSENELKRILHCFNNLGFELSCPLLLDPLDINRINQKLITGLEEFREHLGGVLTIMLLRGIGQGEEIHEIEKSKLDQSIVLIASFQNKKLTV
ncbi:3-dehydroquinate synthase [Aquimarina agarilytica]|uniref:3-dehydroquinate synthase n=1 Tax=Aquimarina agarilytica TaxID=1087449 RepID=UPI0002886F9D|nr:3-dehydroquinate synthase [Aquimarina agarilytica]